MAWDVTFDMVEAAEAIAWFADKLLLTDAEIATLTDAVAERAFYVAGVAQLDLVAQVYDAIENALKYGTTLEEFKAHVADDLEAAWLGTVENPAWRIETIFRTNLQSAYGAGRYEQATEADTLSDRPYWLFDGIDDSRQTKICRTCDGTILAASHEWWQTHVPPLHFNCRSGFITLTEAQAQQRGVTKSPPSIEPEDGFGRAPGAGAGWEAPAADYPPDLWSAFEDKQP